MKEVTGLIINDSDIWEIKPGNKVKVKENFIWYMLEQGLEWKSVKHQYNFIKNEVNQIRAMHKADTHGLDGIYFDLGDDQHTMYTLLLENDKGYFLDLFEVIK